MPAYVTTSHSTLADMATRARRRSDHVNSTFVSDAEVTQYVTESYYELFDLMIESVGPQHFLESHSFSTVAGQSTYKLVDNPDATSQGRPLDIYKTLNVAVNVDGHNRPVRAFQPQDFERLNTTTGWSSASQVKYLFSTDLNKAGDYGAKQYRTVTFTPAPAGAHSVTIYYIPTPIVDAGDGLDTEVLHYTHWDEYIVVDAAMKILEKEESDTQHLAVRKEALRQRILWHASTMDTQDAGSVNDVGYHLDSGRGEPWQ